MTGQDRQEESPEQEGRRSSSRLGYVPVAFVGLAIYYYIYSFITLPFADELWLGELPPLALVQLPKSLLNHRIQDFLISLLPRFGLASGSPSPDLMLTGPWALGLTVTLPALAILFVALLTLPRTRSRRPLIAVLLTAAAVDAAATFWYDATHSLKIF